MNQPNFPHRAPEPLAFGLIVIGDEILSGKRADKHLSKVTELLAARGAGLAWAEYVGDEPRRITRVLQRAFDSGDIVFSTGGIGATPDDHTRQCAAAALGVELQLHPQAKALIEERMRTLAREQGKVYDPERPGHIHRLNMGVFPLGAQIIPNPYNQIPGFSCYPPPSDGSDQAAAAPAAPGIHFVPGFPVMAWPMIEWVLDQLPPLWFSPLNRQERSIILFDAMEATLTPLMLQIERDHPGVKVFSLPSVDHPEWGRHVELGVKGQVEAVEAAYRDLKAGLAPFTTRTGPELVR